MKAIKKTGKRVRDCRRALSNNGYIFANAMLSQLTDNAHTMQLFGTSIPLGLISGTTAYPIKIFMPLINIIQSHSYSNNQMYFNLQMHFWDE